MDDRCGVIVIFGRRHDAVFAVASIKDGDADHQRGGKVPATGVSDRKGVRHRSGSCLGGGDHPRATGARCVRPRAAITAQAKPERPHAGVADPSRVDGVRPWAGPRVSANGSGVVYGFEPGSSEMARLLMAMLSLGVTYRCIRWVGALGGVDPGVRFAPTSVVPVTVSAHALFGRFPGAECENRTPFARRLVRQLGTRTRLMRNQT